MHAFLSSAIFFKSTFSKISFRNNIRVSNSLYPDQARHSVEPDLGPDCLQRLSVENTSRQRVKKSTILMDKHMVVGTVFHIHCF